MLTVHVRRNARLIEDENDDEDDIPRDSHQSPQERGYSLLNSQNAISEVHGDEPSLSEQLDFEWSPPTLGPKSQTEGLLHARWAQCTGSWMSQQSQSSRSHGRQFIFREGPEPPPNQDIRRSRAAALLQSQDQLFIQSPWFQQ